MQCSEYTFFQAVIACQVCSQLITDESPLQLLDMSTDFIVMLCTSVSYKHSLKKRINIVNSNNY